MGFAGTWIGHNDLDATVGLIVGLLTLATVGVSDIVCILFLEFVCSNVGILTELGFPKLQCSLQGETDALEEETKLNTSKVLEMVCRREVMVHVLHTEGKSRLSKQGDIARRNLTSLSIA